jgi:hypothetical protein
MMPLDLRFSGFVIRIRTVETHPYCRAGLVNVCAQHIPPLPQVQNSMMPLPRPTFWCDPHALFLRHLRYSLWNVFVVRIQATQTVIRAASPATNHGSCIPTTTAYGVHSGRSPARHIF